MMRKGQEQSGDLRPWSVRCRRVGILLFARAEDRALQEITPSADAGGYTVRGSSGSAF